MSHFTCLVIGNDVERQLAPFHEFECTGINDQYVVNVDKLAEARDTFATATSTLIIQRPDGTKVDAFGTDGNYAPEFTEFYNRIARELRLPVGYLTLRDEPAARWETLANWASAYYGVSLLSPGEETDTNGAHKYGWARVDAEGNLVELIDRTNPNRKWDWWTVGGRWAGFLLLRDGTRADSAAKGAIDLASIRAQAEAKAATKYDLAQGAIQGREVISWVDMRERHSGDINAARDQYHAQPAVVAFKALGSEFSWEIAEDYTGSRSDFIATAGASAFSTFAVLKDGVWQERGEMGWFGMAANEKEKDAWNTTFYALLADVPDDTVLTVVDCHI